MPDAPAFDLAALGAGLPFAAALDALTEAVTGRGVAVVQAPPGTGKTTLAPPAVAELAGAGRVVVTQPRRVAARAASRRLAALTGTRVGELAGHTVRGDRAVSSTTRVEFVTPGVLVRRLIADPELPGASAVILDEVHERHLDSDLALALLVELRELRDDLPLVAMSATAEAERLASFLGAGGPRAPIVDVDAHTHPLEIRHAPSAAPRFDARGVTDGYLRHVAEVTAATMTDDGSPAGGADADALVFVPGVREIERVAGHLRTLLGDGADVLPLHGGLPAREQDRAVSPRDPGSRRRVVVSTDLAESALTVPGVRLVVDACLTREPRFDSARDMTGLVTVGASRDSCTQRAGRAARTGPGVAARCLAEAEYARLPAHRTPAIATSDLTAFALDVACWGTPRGTGLPLLVAPPVRAMDRAESALRGLDAIDADGHPTDLGRRLAAVPVDPRLARALLDGAAEVGPRVAAEVVALLASDRRIEGADLDGELRRLRSGGDAAWLREAERLRRLAPEDPGSTARSGGGVGTAGLVTALAHPDRVARRTGEQYTLASGTGATLPPGSPLAGHEWLAVAEVARAEGRAAGRAGAIIRAAAALDRETAERAAAGLLREEVTVEVDGARVTARSVRRLGGIVLASTPVAPDSGATRAALVDLVRARGVAPFSPDREAERLLRRLALVRRERGEPWPDLSPSGLADRLDEWLGPELPRIAGGLALAAVDLRACLTRLVPWGATPDAARLDELVPERLTVPSGSSYALDYPEPGSDDPPVLAGKLQEFFGMRSSPTICDGAVPVVVHLLSPAGRPLAVSRDLDYFWREAYPGVRAEMRGRYPKHPWPEDPLTAEPTRRTRR